MTPVNLSPPPSPFQLADQKDEQHLHLYLHSCSSFSCHSTFQDQRMIKLEDSQQHDQKVDQYCIAHGGSSDEQVMNNKTREVGEGSINDNDSSSKWMSSKIRLMQKMMNSDCIETDESSVKITQTLQYQAQLHHDNNEVIGSFNNSNNTVRVCADCNTTTTPLWRSGPRGPKSLCNACGIRQRKARRAMEAAAAAGNGTIAATDNPCTKVKLHSKEKKWRTNHAAQCKKQCKSPDPPHHLGQRKLFFKDFALSLSKNSDLKPVFPQDVEEAAILLMELSCGFIQS